MSVERSLAAPDGRRRSYLLHVPSGLPPGPRPLVVALHGGGESAARFEAVTGLSRQADRDGWVVAYPQGTGDPVEGEPGRERRRSWNAGRCCGPARRDGVDDIGFLEALLDDVGDVLLDDLGDVLLDDEGDVSRDGAGVAVDPDRTFLVGHSNGGMLAYRAALELPGRVAAIGVHSASLAIDRPDRDLPDRVPPVSVIDVHGADDAHHPLEGGRGPASRVETPYASVIDTCARFAAAARCGPPRHDLVDGVATTVWEGPGGVEVRLVVVGGGTHAWMGADPGVAGGVGGAGHDGFDATGAIWSFLAGHPRRS